MYARPKKHVPLHEKSKGYRELQKLALQAHVDNCIDTSTDHNCGDVSDEEALRIYSLIRGEARRQFKYRQGKETQQ